MTRHIIKPIPTDRNGKPRYTIGFWAFWWSYPIGRKKNPDDAFKAWKQKKLESRWEAIVKSVEDHKMHEWKQMDVKYIPYPATFLRAGGYDDEIEAPESPESRYAESLDRQSREMHRQRVAERERLAAIADTIEGMSDDELERAKDEIVKNYPHMATNGWVPLRRSGVWRTMIYDWVERKGVADV